MQEKSDAIVFVGMTYPHGNVRHFALLGCELYKVIEDSADFYYASIQAEVNPGSWSIVRNAIPSNHIICTSTFNELAEISVGLARKYNRVVIHTGGGWSQTKSFVCARRQLGKEIGRRVIFVATTHSYRNNTIFRIPVSIVQFFQYRLYYAAVIFQCKYAADRFVGGKWLIHHGRAFVAPLGCESFDDVSDSVPLGISDKPELVNILKDESLFKFVYLAVLRQGKMHAWLVDAIAPVLRDNPNVRLLLCGSWHEKVYREVLKRIKELSLEGQIFVPGPIPRNEVPWLLKHSNCAVVPSRSETFGHNFLEPMFAGLPVIGTSVGIGCDIINNGVTGYAFCLNDMRSFREAANRVVANIAETEHMGERARALVVDRFTHNAVAKQIVTVYNRILSLRNNK